MRDSSRGMPESAGPPGRRGSLTAGVLTLIFTAALCVLTTGAHAADEEEEVNLRADVLSIPPDISREMRRDARETGFSYLTAAGVIAGYDTNVYRSPSDRVEGAGFIGAGALLRTDSRFGDGQRLKTNLALEGTHYLGQDPLQIHNADVARFSASGSYDVDFGENTGLEVDLGMRYRTDDATSINGNSYVRDFSYWRYHADLAFVWKMSKADELKVGGGFVRRDYDETSGLNSLDWSSGGFDARYRHRFAKRHYVRIWCSLDARSYDEEPASLVDGTELPTNPDEKHHYHKGKLWYSTPIGERVDIDVKYTLTSKRDLFEGYESYTKHSIEAGLRARAGEKTRVGLDLGYNTRDFDHELGDAGELLSYDGLGLDLSLQHRLGESGWLFAKYSYYLRGSNRSTGSVYLDYVGSVFAIGVGASF